MLQKDPSRYLRNGDIEKSSPKEANGVIPQKFKQMYRVRDQDVGLQVSDNQEFRRRKRTVGLGGHNAIKRPYLKTVVVDQDSQREAEPKSLLGNYSSANIQRQQNKEFAKGYLTRTIYLRSGTSNELRGVNTRSQHPINITKLPMRNGTNHLELSLEMQANYINKPKASIYHPVKLSIL